MNTALSVRLNLSLEPLGPPLALKNLGHTDGHTHPRSLLQTRCLERKVATL